MTGKRLSRLECTAYHEAGHAVMNYAHAIDPHARRFKYVTIVPDEKQGSLGHVQYKPWSKPFRPDIEITLVTSHKMEMEIKESLAGPMAEKMAGGRWNHPGARSDYDFANDLAMRLYCSEEACSCYMRLSRIIVREALQYQWDLVKAVATALLEQERLTWEEVDRLIIQQWKQSAMGG